MLLKRDFLNKPFLAFCQQEYDKAKNYLNICGKPKNSTDIFFITFNKNTVKLFKGFLND